MTPITKDSLIQNGFVLEYVNPPRNVYRMSKPIGEWYFQFNHDSNGNEQLLLVADGGYDDSGEFDLSHFEFIEQIDNLIAALNGKIK